LRESISITTQKDWSCSQKHIISKKDIAVAMAVRIVLTHLKAFQNLAAANCWPKKKIASPGPPDRIKHRIVFSRVPAQHRIIFKRLLTFIAMASSKRQSVTPLRAVLPSGKKDTDFFQQVWALVRLIPRGRVTSYGAIAACLGARSGARMVGWAMNSSHGVHPKVPAHRVVNRVGLLSGKDHFASPTAMQEQLEKEGIKIKDNQIVDFEKHFWDPGQALTGHQV
jgi:methylated-DNA-protein-cysteine methyltransferase-like protein